VCSSVVTRTFAYAVHFNSKIFLKDGVGSGEAALPLPKKNELKTRKRLPFCSIHDILYIEGVACVLDTKILGVGVAENGV